MIPVILVLLVIAAILLVIIILIQNPKDGGLSSEFGGGSTNQMFGVQKTGDILEKMTWGLYAFLLVGTLVCGIISKIDSNQQNEASEYDVEKAETLPNIPSPLGTPPAEPAEGGSPAPAPAEGGTPAPAPNQTPANK